ncbi:MAG: hypothetical protein KAQ71_20320, partial [Desulfobulbaceae bacterium]|nr:hypothetical protein [Desulfobulbaceae bacterium]
MKYNLLITILFFSLIPATSAIADRSIVNSKHNLSVSGPGEIRLLVEDRICIFSHTPHNATPFTPLWNKKLEPKTYTLYQSSTLSASPQQPSGPTRLCLSCHDGTIALGDVLQPAEGIQMTMEITANRRSYIGTNISDDHPVSFNYYEALPNPELAQTIPIGLRTYGDGNIHCTTCHDPHDDTYGKFLVMGNSFSALCTTCHNNVAGWSGSSHATSSTMWISPKLKQQTVAEHGCSSCHVPHRAGGPKRLLRYLEEEKNCYSCHDGNGAIFDIKSQFRKISHHPIEATTIDITGNSHDPAENVSFLQGHVECVDCHNPHAANGVQAEAPNASGRLDLVSGKDRTSAVVYPITYEYELCFKCHGDSSNSVPIVTRWSNENNTIREFDPANPSYHPVIAIGQNSDMPSFPSADEPELTATSMISCVDCHDSNDTSELGKGGPRGPHGSIFRPILRQRYDTMDNMLESEFAYALCYRCHERTNLFDNINGSFIFIDQPVNSSGHKKHVVEEHAPCSTCHDPHGVQFDGNGDHSHLINFAVGIVSPYPGNAFPLFQDDGDRAGSCVLVCHGATHHPEDPLAQTTGV